MSTCEHSQRPSVARCVCCGKTLCYECRQQYRSRNFCEQCLPERESKKTTRIKKRRKRKPSQRSPNAALCLSAVPGLGHIYAGSYLKGLGFAAGGVLLILASARFVPFPLVAPLFLFCAWDARMAALKRNFKLSGGTTSRPAGEGDWMLWGGTAVLACIAIWLRVRTGVAVEPWIVWVGFLVVFCLSALMGRGGRNVRQAA